MDGSEECFKRLFAAVEGLKETVERDAAESRHYRERMEKTVDKIETSVHEHQQDVDRMFASMNTRVDDVEDRLAIIQTSYNKARGAYSALQVVGGLVISLFGLVGWFAIHGVPKFVIDGLRQVLENGQHT